MAQMIKVSTQDTFIGRLDFGCDLIEGITALCREKNILFGTVTAIGAVKNARLAYYDQENQKYCHFELDENLEIASLSGNISSLKGQTMAHIHITLADKEGRAYGGHLAPGTEVFACEIWIQSFNEAPLERGKDSETGLPLWDMKDIS